MAGSSDADRAPGWLLNYLAAMDRNLHAMAPSLSPAAPNVACDHHLDIGSTAGSHDPDLHDSCEIPPPREPRRAVCSRLGHAARSSVPVVGCSSAAGASWDVPGFSIPYEMSFR
jgi:hypothetical protein